MAGMRVEPSVTERLATIARAQGGRTVGGRIPADLRTTQQTAHIPGRVLSKRQTGTYIPEFSATGSLSVGTFSDTPLRNVSGSPLTITAVTADLGAVATGSSVQVALYLDGATVATVTVPAGALVGQTSTSFAWPPGGRLLVGVTQVGSSSPGTGLVVQVVTA